MTIFAPELLCIGARRAGFVELACRNGLTSTRLHIRIEMIFLMSYGIYEQRGYRAGVGHDEGKARVMRY